MGFILFLIVNAILFLRPTELVPELLGLHLYLVAIVACLGASAVALVRFLSSPVRSHPTVTFFVALLPLAILSLLVNVDAGAAIDEAFDFAKVLVYFVLFLALVTTAARLRGIIAVVVLCVMVTSIVGILHFQGVISVPALEVLGEQIRDPDTHEWTRVRRLRFTGMLQDPNEVAVFLSVLVFLCAAQWQYRPYGTLRHLWLLPMAVFLASIGFTVSRGGLLALLVGTGAFAVYRFGRRQALTFLAVVLPVALLAFAGRQTSFSATEGTGNSRIGLWSDWMDVFRGQPVFGVSPKITPAPPPVEGAYVATKHCAHNSYLQAFADLGFVGGLLFLGASLLALVTLHRYGLGQTYVLDAEQKRLHPYLMAAVVAYLAGMMTLVLNYMITTAFVLALPLTYYGMTPCYPAVRRPTLDAATVGKLVAASVGYLAFLYVIIRLFRNY